MNSPAYDVMNLLGGSAIGAGEAGTDMFTGFEPPSPNNCITVFDTGGFEGDAVNDYRKPTVQVRVRNTAYAAGWIKANEIHMALHGLHNTTEDGTRYIGIWAMGEPSAIGYDENDRALFVVNFRIHRTAA